MFRGLKVLVYEEKKKKKRPVGKGVCGRWRSGMFRG
jgi:hypothetical protein